MDTSLVSAVLLRVLTVFAESFHRTHENRPPDSANSLSNSRVLPAIAPGTRSVIIVGSCQPHGR